MNISLKNPFKRLATSSEPPEPPGSAGTIPTDAWGKIKGLQLLKGRTRTKVENLMAEVDTARADLAHATQAHGGALYEEQDSTAEALAAQQAALRVAALEAALAVAIQKDDEAQRALAEATRQASIATDDEVNTAFKDTVVALEALLCGALKPAVEKVAVARQVVIDRSEADSLVGSAIVDFDRWFKVYLHRNCAALIPGAGAWVKDIDEDKKPLSAWVDNVTYAMSRRKGR